MFLVGMAVGAILFTHDSELKQIASHEAGTAVSLLNGPPLSKLCGLNGLNGICAPTGPRVHGRFRPDICPRQRNKIFISALSGEPNMGLIMWISVWAVTIALAIGFSVMAVAMQSENDHAALGR